MNNRQLGSGLSPVDKFQVRRIHAFTHLLEPALTFTHSLGEASASTRDLSALPVPPRDQRKLLWNQLDRLQ
jgi:hypothetical protein